MPTEEETRELLAKAAATIAVEETAPMTLTGLPDPRPRRWPVLAAAAGVVLAIGVGLLVAQQLGDDPEPAPAVDETDAADREPIEQEYLYDDDEMPSLLGYTEEEATELIHSRGNPLRVEAEYSCELPKGFVIGTDPGPGTPLAPGDEVEIRVIAGILPTARCSPPWQDVWDLVRFARGLGPAPVFPDEVNIAVGESEFVTLTGEAAADPANWVLCEDGACHSALAALAQVLTTPVEMDGFFARTFLVATDELPVLEGPDPMCLTPDPMNTPNADKVYGATYVYVDHPVDGVRLCPPPPVVQVDWTEDQRIASVRLRLALEAETITEEELEGSLARLSSATQFVTWARGDGPAPEFALPLRRLVSGSEWGTIDDPLDRGQWAPRCPRFMSAPCPPSALDALQRYAGRVAQSSTPAHGCMARPRLWPDDLKMAVHSDLVRLDQPEAEGCADQWSVELWIDDEGRIYAVNSSVPSS